MSLWQLKAFCQWKQFFSQATDGLKKILEGNFYFFARETNSALWFLIKQIILRRWNFISFNSLKFAFISVPKNKQARKDHPRAFLFFLLRVSAISTGRNWRISLKLTNWLWAFSADDEWYLTLPTPGRCFGCPDLGLNLQLAASHKWPREKSAPSKTEIGRGGENQSDESICF